MSGMKGRERENFYILLELGYDPPVADAEAIDAALQAKTQEWTRWQENPGRRGQALIYLGMTDEIREVMNDPARREQEAKDAATLRSAVLRQFEAELRVLEAKGYILPREETALTVKYRNYGVTKELVEKAARAPISETPVEIRRNRGKEGELLDRTTARTIERNLALLHRATLYEFLGEASSSPAKALCASAEKKRETPESAGQKGGNAVAQELAGICLRIFADEASKAKYDRYLEVGGYPDLSEMIDQEFVRANYVSHESLLRLVNFGVERYGLRVLEAEDAVFRYCAAYRIPVGEKVIPVCCPACATAADPGSASCSACGAPLKGECPGCGAHFDDGPAVCPSCGFAIGEMVKALKHLGDAENALIENNWSTARRSLDYAEKYWPGHPKLEILGKRTILIEERYATYVENISDCVKHKQFYAALDLVREATARRIPLPSSTVQHVEKVVTDLEARLALLQRGGGEPEFDEVMALAETVGDSMELTHLLRRYPPEAPSRLNAAINEGAVRLTWSVSKSAGMKEYIVVRREGATPLTAYDGDVLYQGAANSYLDRSAEPLREYYYAVYTQRGGACSPNAATTDAVLIIPEVRNLRILPTDMGAQLSWDYDPNVKEIVLWRKLGGDRPTAPGEGMQLESVRLDGYTDQRIKNGVEYWYYIYAVYNVGGKRACSRGISESVMPRQMLAPIENLVIAQTGNEENEYVASWQGSHYSDVLLFVTQRQPSCRRGELVRLSDLIAKYQKLDLDAKQPESARFRYSWNGGLYIFPAAITGKFATIGEIRYLSNVQDVTNPSFDIIEEDIFLSMDWPAGLGELAVTYRFDRFASDPEESGATTVYYTQEQYSYDSGVRIKEAEPAVYYITVFSVFDTPEHRRIYSPGVNMLVNNMPKLEVFYRFTRSKKLFSQASVISAAIRAGENFVLPKAVIIGKVGRLPLSKNDGIPLFEIDRETKVDGSVVFEYRTSTLPENLYIRLFLREEKHYEKLRLIPLEGLKIT